MKVDVPMGVLAPKQPAPDPRDLVHVEDGTRWSERVMYRGPAGRELFVVARCGSRVPISATTSGSCLRLTCRGCST